ncbi:hypothetical protein [Pseudoxanthomonas sp.]|uniref:hypothetical protein n=1 Tax=Pseudoxanthomonas sp. TaxID=1871049 RepID=UPI002E12417B|nr:hypothetical protein [Pseudoxanthomonas sp.]
MSSPDQLIVDHLGEFGIKAYSNFLGAAFQLAVVELSASNLHSSLDEESITAALLGAFSVTTPICASALSVPYGISSSWVRYSKNSTNGMAEKDTGADFALLIRLDTKRSRLAIFQAKKSGSIAGSFDVSSNSPETSSRPKVEKQFTRLKDFSISILEESTRRRELSGPVESPPSGIKSLQWSHYLIYGHGGFHCCPLSSLIDVDQAICSSSPLATVRLANREHFGFAQMLNQGADIASAEAPGWLTLNNLSTTKRTVAEARKRFTVYEASACPELSLKAVLSNERDPLPRGLLVKRARHGLKPKTSPKPGSRQGPRA